MIHKRRLSTVSYYTVAIIIGIMAMIPFAWMVSTSLKARGALMSIPIEWIPEEPTLDSYLKVFSKFPFMKTIGNSLVISITYTVITLISGSMAAFAFAKMRFAKADLLLKIFLATMMIPTQVTIIPLFVVMNKMSLINTYGSVILPSIFRPFAIFLLVQQMRTIPDDFLDAARIDGASNFHVYFKVALPLCAPTLATLAITTFMESWNDYLWPLLMLTDKAKMTLPIALSTLNGQYSTEYNVLMAGALISMVPIVLIYVFAQKYFQNGMMAGGIKG
ncbi:MAG: carbohydrate ABC transporter permease [Bacillota bacterium]|nr:carbohydrate ABC transporter permease [Bacillota bacterium]